MDFAHVIRVVSPLFVPVSLGFIYVVFYRLLCFFSIKKY